MKFDLLVKYAENENLNIKIKKVWRDSFSNLLIIFEMLGRKYSAIGSADPNNKDLSHFHGIGSSKKTKDMPAGRGDYLTGEPINQSIAEKIRDSLKSQAPQEEIINNKSGISWAPRNKTEKDNLAALVEKSGEINSDLSEIGMIYSGGDKLIYGEDITADDVLAFPIASAKESDPPAPTPKPAPAITSGARGNTPEVESFIKFLSQSYSRKFGREIKIGSTFRNSVEQAWAMRYPLASGDYDRLYGHLGPAADQIKELISAKRYEEAAKIIDGTSLITRSHMAGRAIDIGFNSNGLKTSDYNKFIAVVEDASKESGIRARVNSEKSTHFHIDVG